MLTVGFALMFVMPLLGIQHKYSNWKVFLVKRLTGAKTLPSDFNSKVRHSCRGALVKDEMF